VGTSDAANVSKKCPPNNSVAIGAGVGIPLGLLVLGLLGYLFTREGKKRKHRTEGADTMTEYKAAHKAPTYEIDSNIRPAELPEEGAK
jgi:hypothetical protein